MFKGLISRWNVFGIRLTMYSRPFDASNTAVLRRAAENSSQNVSFPQANSVLRLASQPEQNWNVCSSVTIFPWKLGLKNATKIRLISINSNGSAALSSPFQIGFVLSSNEGLPRTAARRPRISPASEMQNKSCCKFGTFWKEFICPKSESLLIYSKDAWLDWSADSVDASKSDTGALTNPGGTRDSDGANLMHPVFHQGNEANHT